ncbi:MAG: hypothetical protein KDC80_13990 [Saprospiraceae bacterium]|nr:hypothetical protein [Saprospiraceae bacterium]
MAERLISRWLSFQEQATKIYPYFQKFGFKLESISYGKVANTNSWRFTALYRNSKRLLNLSLITALDRDGAVSFFITRVPDKEENRTINLYKYLRKHFSMLNRKSLFLNRYSGDFSQRLQKVFRSYARFSQFYMQSILHGTWWDD